MVDSIESGNSADQSRVKQGTDVRSLGSIRGEFKAMVEAGLRTGPTPGEFKVAAMDKLDVMGWERAVAVGAEAFSTGMPSADFTARVEALAAGMDNVRSGRHLSRPSN